MLAISNSVLSSNLLLLFGALTVVLGAIPYIKLH